MSQINPYRPIVVPTPKPPKAWPKKEGQGKSKQGGREHKKDEAKKEGEGLDVTA